MAWSKIAKTGAAFLTAYIAKTVKKQTLKKIIHGEIDDFAGEDDFVEDNILGIKELNKGEKCIDSYASDYTL